jgi:hypothetical protein
MLHSGDSAFLWRFNGWCGSSHAVCALASRYSIALLWLIQFCKPRLLDEHDDDDATNDDGIKILLMTIIIGPIRQCTPCRAQTDFVLANLTDFVARIRRRRQMCSVQATMIASNAVAWQLFVCGADLNEISQAAVKYSYNNGTVSWQTSDSIELLIRSNNPPVIYIYTTLL